MTRASGCDTQILRLLAQGYTRKEIAGMLGLSPNAIRHHIEATRARLGARNTLHAVVLSLRQSN